MDVCGLAPNEPDSDSGVPVALIGDVRHTTVGDGNYTETTLGGTVRIGERLSAGGRVPIVSVHQADERTSGLGNAVAFSQVRLLDTTARTHLALGLQIEAPTVSDDALGDAHFLMLPNIQLAWSNSSAHFSSILGFGHILDYTSGNSGTDGHSHHHHGAEAGHTNHSSSIVNRHASREALTRIDGGMAWNAAAARMTAAVRADGILELDGDASDRLIVSTGPVISVSRGTLTAELSALLPVSSARRYESRTTLRMRVQLP